MNDYIDKKRYLEEHLFSKNDLERIKTVISMCEKIKVQIINNRLVITKEPADLSQNELQDIWDECWNRLKKEGLDMLT